MFFTKKQLNNVLKNVLQHKTGLREVAVLYKVGIDTLH